MILLVSSKTLLSHYFYVFYFSLSYVSHTFLSVLYINIWDLKSPCPFCVFLSQSQTSKKCLKFFLTMAGSSLYKNNMQLWTLPLIQCFILIVRIGVMKFVVLFFRVSALFGQYLTLSKFSRLGPVWYNSGLGNRLTGRFFVKNE